MDPTTPAKAVGKAARAVADKAAELLEPAIPGAPGLEPPSLEEPDEPREPLPPEPDQGAPDTRTPSGAETGARRAGGVSRVS